MTKQIKIKYIESLQKHYKSILGNLYVELSSSNTRTDEEEKDIVEEMNTCKQLVESLQIIINDYNNGLIK